MDIELLEKKFAGIGARMKLREIDNRWRQFQGINILTDERGEFFDIRVQPGEQVEYDVVDLRPDMRHLLLLARRETGKEKFLCGHDERHWFVCAVPGAAVTNVLTAMEALQPLEVRRQVARKVKRVKNRFNRHNEAFVRQGEWFFIPAPELKVNPKLIHLNEPISRGGGSKPHMCQHLYRDKGEAVMVCRQHPNGVTLRQYDALLKSNPKARKWSWRAMRRNAFVYAQGRIWHKDHKTIVLDGWHRVLMNTESQADWSKSVVFLD
ncbi:MAG TPA: hypothetical protein VGC91_07435 [Pyrinomonadaceae bacterium]|jgi:hypothetical protein